MEVSTKTLLQDGDISKNQEELIFDPYNSKNREITETQVSEILKKLARAAREIFNYIIDFSRFFCVFLCACKT